MYTHVKVLAILHIALGAMGLIAGIGFAVLFGGVAGITGMSAPPEDSIIAIPILGAVGGILMLISIVLGLPGVIAGIGLLSFRPWARILTIVLSVLHLLNFPFGTALGVYGLWVLFSQEATMLFSRPAVAPQYPR